MTIFATLTLRPLITVPSGHCVSQTHPVLFLHTTFRLSSATAAKVLDNNPNIADLSDPNRPQKLGEQFSQMYDDQWTDATEALEKLEINEEKIIQTLLDIIVVCTILVNYSCFLS